MSANQYGIPTPIQFDRLYAGPLDKHEVFDSYADALTYAQGSISYAGQVLGVKKSGLKEDVYVINQDKSLSRLMIQRENLNLVLKASDWTGEVPFEQKLTIAELESTDNCIISLGDSANDADIVREIVNAKIADTIQEDGGIRFIARGDKPTIDIPILVTIGSVVSAVEIPNNVNDNTNYTVVVASKDGWKGSKPPYTQDLYVFGVRPDSMGTIGINPDSSYYNINRSAAAAAGVVRYEQGNNYVTIAAMNSKPTRDLEVLVVWGDNIVVFENSDVLEDFNTTLDLVLKVNKWSENRPYTQTLRVEGLSEYHTGAIGLSDNCTVEQAEQGLNAGLELINQGNGEITIRANDDKPSIDIPIYLIYGSNIAVVPSPEYVGEANRHVDTMAYASRWTQTVNGWEQEVDVEGITSNSIGTMGLRNGATENQAYDAAVARIKITKVFDNRVLLTATRKRPSINIPLSFVFGRNINVVKIPGVTGKVSLDTSYIIFDDTLINSGVSSLQQLLEYLQKNKINYTDIVNNKVTNDPLKPLSSSIGKEINDDLQEHKDTSTIHVPTTGTNGQYLMYKDSVDGNKEWHTLNVDGVNADSNGDIVHFATYKSPSTNMLYSNLIEVNCPGFKLKTGAKINIEFKNVYILQYPSLVVNNTGTKPIYYKDSEIATGIQIDNSRVYSFIYNGTNYVLLGDITNITNSNTTKAYITGTTSQNTTIDPNQVFDTNVYLDTTAGKLHTKSIDVGTDGITTEGNLTVTGTSTLGTTNINSTVTVAGNTTLSASLQVDGPSTFNNSVDIKGDTNIGTKNDDGKKNLYVYGNELISDNLQVNGGITIGSTSNHAHLNIFGISTLQGNTDIGTTSNNKNLTVNGNETVTGTLGVTGTSTLGTTNIGTSSSNKNLTVNGNETITGTLGVTGYVNTPNLSSDIIIKVQSEQPAAIDGKNIIWIQI